VAQVYEDAGIEVTLRVLDRTAQTAAKDTGDYEANLDTPNVVLPSASSFFREQYLPGGREPFAAEPPKEFMELFDEILATPTSSKRDRLIKKALKITREDWVPVVPFDKQVGSAEIIAKYVHGRTPATGQWFNVHWYHDIWVDGNSPRK
jgi:ABC-type transport system substrate-binding protein